MNLFKIIFNEEKRDLKEMQDFANKVEQYSAPYKALSDEELKHKTIEFKERLGKGETLDDIAPEAFATVREASLRVNNEYPYPVQLMAGYVLHKGDLAEAVTGSGKTLSSVAPAYLNALEGKGVHIITVNEYLSERDSIKNGAIFNYLGLTVGLNLKGLTFEEKKAAYDCDITYTTNSEVGFDYLRDNMVFSLDKRVLRGLNYVIIDEADSVLIDEARTPLIISGGQRGTTEGYITADRFVKALKTSDYEIDIKHKDIQLTPEGVQKADKFYKVENIYDGDNDEILHYIYQALKANYVMKKDVDYIVEGDEITIIDQSTGRKMYGREFSEGLHQAIQAKERVTVVLEAMTQATITYQNFFRLYKKVSGMTGTAKTEEEEFLSIYNMRVVVIPTNEPVIRDDQEDSVFGTKQAKYNAIIEEVQRLHSEGRPVLIGTPSVEISEIISSRLKKVKLKHEVLNAKNHAREADIIAQAGQRGAITVATNMAGRGTDIKLGEGVNDLGGLAVIGVERHESRRIDNQLRGRAGRQGDRGSSKFYVSMEDDLMRRFGNEKTLDTFKNMGDMSVQNKVLTKAITSAQESVEGMHFDARKTLLEYDNVLSNQREIVYKKRNKIMNDGAHEFVLDMMERYIDKAVSEIADKKVNLEELKKLTDSLGLSECKETNLKKAQSALEDEFMDRLEAIEEQVGENLFKSEKILSLAELSNAWIYHIDTMYKLRDGIGLRGYSSGNPLNDYVTEAYEIFDEMIDNVAKRITYQVSSFIRH